jgi:hypothetical protein
MLLADVAIVIMVQLIYNSETLASAQQLVQREPTAHYMYVQSAVALGRGNVIKCSDSGLVGRHRFIVCKLAESDFTFLPAAQGMCERQSAAIAIAID